MLSNLFLILITLKLVGLAELTWFQVFIPFMIHLFMSFLIALLKNIQERLDE